MPGANRASVIGMFENIGRLSTRWVSNRAPDFSDVVSRSGVSRLDDDLFGDLADLERERHGQLLADAEGQAVADAAL